MIDEPIGDTRDIIGNIIYNIERIQRREENQCKDISGNRIETIGGKKRQKSIKAIRLDNILVIDGIRKTKRLRAHGNTIECICYKCWAHRKHHEIP